MTIDKKIQVCVMFGGRSGEHAVSLSSARFIISVLDETKYDVIQVGITRDGRWFTGLNALKALTEEKLEGLIPVSLLPDPSRPGLITLDGSGVTYQVDVYFPVLHGTFGEDGTLQGLFEMANAAYVGPNVVGAAVGMDKAVFADVMKANGIPVVPTMLVLRSELENDPKAVVQRCEEFQPYPLFIKPANLGSSVGISKVKSHSDLIEGLMEAAQYDRRMVVQKGINVREIEVAVLGNDHPQASVCGEVLPGEEFYSYNAKYHDDDSQTLIPADIPQELSDNIRETAIRAYLANDLSGLARVDFFIDKDTNDIYLNELNTIPGFTEISMYPMLWEASGVPNNELVDKLIEFAFERKAQRDSTKRDFRRS